jgi:5'-deoxynucleotidase YfbR-like HD superfamily hydrolase
VTNAAWIQTYTGRAFPIFDPQEDDIDIRDIAHALSQICRFTGHTREFYSVAQHSVLVSKHVPPELALQALLHDAPEAYIGDMNRPLKHSGLMDGFKDVEDVLWKAIANAFGVPQEMDAKVKAADNRALFSEQRDLMGRVPKPWKDPVEPYEEAIVPLGPKEARALFLQRYLALVIMPVAEGAR